MKLERMQRRSNARIFARHCTRWRAAIRELLSRHAGRLEFVPGETYFNNPGVTVVYPKHPLPAPSPNPLAGRR